MEGKSNAGFDISSIFPKRVINSQDKIEPFSIGMIKDTLVRDLGLQEDLAQQITDEVVRKIVRQELQEIRTSHIKDLVGSQLGLMGLDKYKSLFVNEFQNFSLEEAFIEKYKTIQPKWGPLGYFTYKRTYSRIKDDGSKEEFWETLRRVVEGCYSIQKTHCKNLQLPWDDGKAQRSAQRMYKIFWSFKALPPGRGLWTMGTDFVRKHGSMSLNNCGFISTVDIERKKATPFLFVMDALMLGVGVGFDTKGAGKLNIMNPKEGTFIYQIPDSREGWIEGFKLLLNAFFEGTQIPTFDLSLIRAKGMPIKGFGGIASGPEPLNNMYNSIKKLLTDRIGTTLNSVDIVDMMNFIGRCVVAGNVRRSAEIALGSYDDEGYVTMKDPDIYPEECKDRRWASNNSIFGEVGMDYSNIVESIAKNGEPGIFWLENSRAYSRMNCNPDFKDKDVMGVNPCGEQCLESTELCCLAEVFPSNIESYDEFEGALKFAYLYAKSVTLMKTHWKETNAVMLKNRRMGISLSGIANAFVRHGRRKFLRWCDKGYNFIKELDDLYSRWLCVPKSIKITTVKPSGTVSLLPGVSPGIHYPHSKYYIRRIRVADNSELVPKLREAGYYMEPVATGEETMVVVEFPVQENNFERGKRDVSMWEQLQNAADIQRYWSDNQVSITVTFDKEEAKWLRYALEQFEDKLKSVSFLPLSDHGYEQAPYEEITEEQYEERTKNLKPVNFEGYVEREKGSLHCDAGKCEYN